MCLKTDSIGVGRMGDCADTTAEAARAGGPDRDNLGAALRDEPVAARMARGLPAPVLRSRDRRCVLVWRAGWAGNRNCDLGGLPASHPHIRELENVIERALVLDKDGVLALDDLPDRLRAREHRVADLRMELPDEGISLENVERELLLAALEKHNWNQTRAGAFLNITHSTLLYRMQKFGLERDRKAAESPASE